MDVNVVLVHRTVAYTSANSCILLLSIYNNSKSKARQMTHEVVSESQDDVDEGSIIRCKLLWSEGASKFCMELSTGRSG